MRFKEKRLINNSYRGYKYLYREKVVDYLRFAQCTYTVSINNTRHASRKICAPWWVTFFWGLQK